MGLKIGIAADGSTLGSAGGVDVYIRLLVEALAEYDQRNQYYVLLREKGDLVETPAIDAWSNRKWARNTRFIVIRDHALPETRRARWRRRVQQKLGRPLPEIPNKVEPYRAYQIDRLHLNLVHYPRTAISPLELETPCVLGFSDLQHEYLPEFFTQSEREERTRHFRVIVAKARHIITPSHYTKQTLIEKYAVPDAKISVVPHGLPPSFCRASDAEVNRVRAQYHLPQEFIYYPANTWLHKNHQLLFKSLRRYRDQYEQTPTLVLSGRLRGNYPNALEMAQAEGIAEQVIDLGFVPREDCSALYTAATMLVFPSLFEGFGIPLVEAMACGCPIAAANTTAIPECVGDDAILFDPLNVNEMTEAIHQLLTDASLRGKLASGGLVRVERFRWAHIIPQLLTVYTRTAAQAKGFN